QAFGLRIDLHLDLTSVSGWSDVSRILHFEAPWRELKPRRLIQFHRLTFVIDEGIGKRVEGQVTRDRECCRDFRRSHERVRIRVPVVSLCKVPVKGSDDGVLAIRVVRVACPLSNTRTAGIRKHYTAHFFEDVEVAIAFHCVADLLRTRSYGEFCSCLDLF